jgi:hypothetical protein
VSWIHYRQGPWLIRIASHTCFTIVLFVAHLFALGIYGLTIGCYEASRIVGYRQAARTFAVMASPVVALYLYLVWSGGAVGKPIFDWWFGLKLIWPLLIMNGYSAPLSIALALTIAALLVFLGYNRAFGLTRPAIFIGSGFLILYPLMPTRLFDSAYADVRLITATMLILPAFLTVNWPSGTIRSVATLVAATVILANAARVSLVGLPFGLCRDRRVVSATST